MLVIREKEWEAKYVHLENLKEQVSQHNERDHLQKSYLVDQLTKEELEELEKVIEDREFKIQKLQEDQRITRQVDVKLIHAREKYRQTTQDYEFLRKHIESEYFRSLLDQPIQLRLYYESIYQEIQRKKRIKKNLEDEREKFDESIAQLRQSSKEQSSKNQKLTEELEKYS